MPLDAEDIAALYDRHAGEVLRFLAHRTFDPDTAVDLLAETFAAAFEARSQFRGESPEAARAWVFGIARHRLLGFLRRGQIERHAVARLGIEHRALTESEYDRIEELAVSRARRDAVGEQLRTMSVADRELLRLRVVDERPYAEVARELGISEENARARTSRALRALRDSPALKNLTETADA